MPLGITSEDAWRDQNWNHEYDPGEPTGSFTIAAAYEVGQGRIAAVADNAFQDDGFDWRSNDLFMRSLLRWVTGWRPAYDSRVFLPIILKKSDAPSPSPTLCDYFDDPTYDGSFNTELWTYYIDPQAYQQSGVLVFPSTSGPDNWDRQLWPRQPLDWHLDDLGYIEAKLKLSDDVQGDFSMVKVNLSSHVGGEPWFTQCYLAGEETRHYFHCDVYNPEFEFVTADIEVDYNTWYTVRIEIDPDTTMRFYLDGQLVDSYQPVDAAELQEATFRPKFGMWYRWPSMGTGYFDHVCIGP